MKDLTPLLTKRFSVYVCGEFEMFVNFIGMIDLLFRKSDFPQYSREGQKQEIKKWLKQKWIYVDCDTEIRFN